MENNNKSYSSKRFFPMSLLHVRPCCKGAIVTVDRLENFHLHACRMAPLTQRWSLSEGNFSDFKHKSSSYSADLEDQAPILFSIAADLKFIPFGIC
jgi:hypothetical protein